jgi:hypothetical protein
MYAWKGKHPDVRTMVASKNEKMNTLDDFAMVKNIKSFR